MGSIGDILTVAIVFTAIYWILKLFVGRKDRLMMIEKTSSVSEIKNEGFSFPALKFGIFFIGIGLGILIANILTITTSLDSEVAYFSMVFLFGGLSLLIAHYLERKKK